MLDSGAFNFLKHAEISIDPRDVLTIGIDLKADVSVVLDHPLHPKSGRKEQSEKFGSNTIANTRSMFETLKECGQGLYSSDFRLMPVLHGYNTETLKRSLDDIVEIWGQEPTIIGDREPGTTGAQWEQAHGDRYHSFGKAASPRSCCDYSLLSS